MFRKSKWIDFDSGVVTTAPMDLKQSFKGSLSTADKIDLFECRVDVWQLGVAVEMLKQIEAAHNPSIWSHAAYGLVSVMFTYFEMIGKTLNPASKTRNTASDDLDEGFRDVYPAFASRPTDVAAFRNRIRNGLYHLGYTKDGLWLHNRAGSDAFEVTSKTDSAGNKVSEYWMNPHQATRDVLDHFPGFITRVKADPPTQTKFLEYFDTFFAA